MPKELTESAQAIYYQRDNPSFSLQSVDEIMKIVAEARNPPPSSKPIRGFGWGAEDEEEGIEDIDAEVEEEDGEEDEYDKRGQRGSCKWRVSNQLSCFILLWS